jgi:hypothetical protein
LAKIIIYPRKLLVGNQLQQGAIIEPQPSKRCYLAQRPGHVNLK